MISYESLLFYSVVEPDHHFFAGMAFFRGVQCIERTIYLDGFPVHGEQIEPSPVFVACEL